MEYLIHILVITGIYIILTLSLNLVVDYTGLPALGQRGVLMRRRVYIIPAGAELRYHSLAGTADEQSGT
jgi:hypothetical protein